MGMSAGQSSAYFANKRKEQEEKKPNNKKWAFIQAMHDKKAHEQHLKDMANVCPKCFIVRNSARICVMGCDDID